MTTRKYQLGDEDFQPEVGLADDFDGVVSDAYFAIDPDYSRVSAKETPMLFLKITSPQFEPPAIAKFSTGEKKGWQVVDNGAEVISTTDPDSHKFNINSRAGQVVDRMLTLLGSGNREKGAEVLRARGFAMTQGAFYVGFSTHWKREKLSTVGGESRDVLMPSKVGQFTGVVASPAASASTDSFDPEFVAVVKKLASGTDFKTLQIAVLKQPKEWKDKYEKTMMPLVFVKDSSNVITQLEQQGELVKNPADGKFI